MSALSKLDHSWLYKLLELSHNIWVFECFLGCGIVRIFLETPHNVHKNRIAHDCLYFWILHGLLHTLLVVILGFPNTHHCKFRPLKSLNAFLTLRVDLEAFLIGVHCLMVFLHPEMTSTFTSPGFDKVGVKFKAFISHFSAEIVLHQFYVTSRHVRINLCIFRVSPLSLLIFLESLREFVGFV